MVAIIFTAGCAHSQTQRPADRVEAAQDAALALLTEARAEWDSPSPAQSRRFDDSRVRDALENAIGLLAAQRHTAPPTQTTGGATPSPGHERRTHELITRAMRTLYDGAPGDPTCAVVKQLGETEERSYGASDNYDHAADQLNDAIWSLDAALHTGDLTDDTPRREALAAKAELPTSLSLSSRETIQNTYIEGEAPSTVAQAVGHLTEVARALTVSEPDVARACRRDAALAYIRAALHELSNVVVQH